MIRSAIPIQDRARHRWRSLLPRFGVDPRFLVPKQGPCPICEGRTRFRFDDKDGEGTWYCNHDGAGDGFRLIMLLNGWSFAEAAKHVEHELGDTQVETAKPRARDAEALKRRMNEAWRGAGVLAPDTAAGRYLVARLGRIPAATDLRAAASLWCKGDDGPATHRPAMLALVRGADGVPTGLHRTYLTDAGAKAPIDAPKQVLGATPAGAAVRLCAHASVLGIAEGIETALAATAMFEVPCWAALNAGQLERWNPPGGVEHVIVFADRDHSFVGQRVSGALAERLVRDGFNVELRTPDRIGTDWADVLADQLAGGKAA